MRQIGRWRRGNRHLAWWGVIVAGLAAASAASPADPDLERELRCCVQLKSLGGKFLIKLSGMPRPVAHLRITTPQGVVVGYDPASGLFRPPTDSVLYASVYPNMPELTVEWLRQRERVLALGAVPAGDYRVEVLGVGDGSYTLQFDPAGYGVSGVNQSFIRVPIKTGQAHVYLFRAPFADPRDGSVRRDSPDRFKVQRLP